MRIHTIAQTGTGINMLVINLRLVYKNLANL